MTETILLNLEVDQTQAQKALVQTEKNINALKKSQADLNKEYKAGKITEDAYIKSNIQLQRAIKNENEQKRTLNKLLETESGSRNAVKLRTAELVKEYDNLNRSTTEGAKRAKELQKELKALSEDTTKSSKAAGLFKDQIGNYPGPFNQAIGSVSNFTKSTEGLLSSSTLLTGALGAGLGVLGALTTAYASSTVGARDLARAQGLISSATEIATESFGEFIASLTKSDEGIGLFEGLAAGFLAQINPALLAQAAIKNNNKELLKDLEISRTLAAGFAKDDERRAEQARRIRDDESKSLEERLAQVQTIDDAFNASLSRTTAVIEAQIEAIKRSTTGYENNREAQARVAALASEIKDKEEEITGKLTENVTARRTILGLIEAERQATAADDRAQRRAIDTAPTGAGPLTGADFLADAKAQELKTTADFNKLLLQENKNFYERDLEFKKRSVAAKAAADQSALQSTAAILAAGSSLFEQASEEYKVLATFQTLISTYSAAQKAYESQAAIPFVGPELGVLAAAAAVALGLANVAAINGIQFAEGGYTGPGSKYQPAGIVHAGEVVWSQKDVAMAGGPAAANAMRPTALRGYADGGFVTTANTVDTQQALMMANAIKNIPAGVVSWTEGQAVGRRVQWRESISKV